MYGLWLPPLLVMWMTLCLSAVASRDWSCCSQVSSLSLMVAGTVMASPSTLVKGVNEILR